MKAKFTINVNALNSVDAHAIDGFFIQWQNVTDRVNFSNWFQDEDLLSIESTHDEINFNVEYTSGGGQTLDRDFEQLSTNGIWIRFTAECDFYPEIQILQNLGVIMDITPLQGESLIYLYSLNSANNVLNKDITLVEVLNGKFNHLVGLKNLNIDIINYHNNCNYAYIPSLNRYYYVDSVEFVSGDYTRLHLREDVLMSWQTLIKRQSAQITRWENSQEFIIDERLPLESKAYVLYQSLDNTPSAQSLVNCTFDLTYSTSDLVYFVTTIATLESSTNYAVRSPTNSNLPDVYPRKNKSKHYYILNYEEYGYFNVACIKKSTTASFVVSALWLPFKVADTQGFSLSQAPTRMYAGTEALTNGKTWEDAGSSGFTFLDITEVENGAIPYLVTHDFTFPNVDNFLDYQPYKKIEIYLAFVGYVTLSVTELAGKRCLIYYALDVETGSATCYLYNYTDKKCVFSQTCQLGIKQEFNTSNFYQNNLQRELLMMGTLFSGMQNALSAGSAFASENYFKGASNIIAIEGTIAKYPVQNALISDSMSTSFGSSENALYTLYDSYLKITYRKAVTMPDLSDYYKLQGKPYNKYFDRIPNNITGYVEIGEIHFNPMNETIYQDEINEIVSLLKLGVIL